MNVLSTRRLSFLGLALLVASAVAAAVMPEHKPDKTTANYSLTNSTALDGSDCDLEGKQQLSCTFSNLTSVNQPCTNTDDSNTTASGIGSSTVNDVHAVAGGDTGVNANTSRSPC